MNKSFAPMPDSKRLLAALAAAALAGVLSAPGALAAEPQVPVVRAGAGPVAGGSEWDGTLQAVRQTTISAQTTGRITRRLVVAGDRVAAGQKLFEIDDRETALNVARGNAQVAEAQAAWTNAQASYQRSAELQRRGFISQAALDQAEAQLKVADAQRKQAEAAARLSQVASGYTAVVAPYAGVVTAVKVELGDLATPGRPLVDLHADDRLRAVAYLPAVRAGSIGSSTRAQVQVTDPRGERKWIAGASVTVIPAADAGTSTTEVRVELPPDAVAAVGGLVPGRSVRVRFETGAAVEALTIPASAVLYRGELQGVYVQGERGFVLRAVRLGRSLGDRVEVLSGLKAGEAVAADPIRAGLAR